MLENLLHRYGVHLALDHQVSNPLELWRISLMLHVEMQVLLHRLLHKSLQTPPLTITPTTVDTPPSERYTHVSYTLSP
jgi:hypothetical protein